MVSLEKGFRSSLTSSRDTSRYCKEGKDDYMQHTYFVLRRIKQKQYGLGGVHRKREREREGKRERERERGGGTLYTTLRMIFFF
jgi:hypothetical protein